MDGILITRKSVLGVCAALAEPNTQHGQNSDPPPRGVGQLKDKPGSERIAKQQGFRFHCIPPGYSAVYGMVSVLFPLLLLSPRLTRPDVGTADVPAAEPSLLHGSLSAALAEWDTGVFL